MGTDTFSFLALQGDEALEEISSSTLPNVTLPCRRAGMLSASNSPVGRWLRGGGLSIGSGAAKRTRDAARLKALQRTPYPMVLARIKLLLDRLQVGGEGDWEMCGIGSTPHICGVGCMECGGVQGAGSPLQQHRACTTCKLHPLYPGHRPQVTLTTTPPSLKCDSLAAVQRRKHGNGAPTPRRQSVRKGDCFFALLRSSSASR